MANFAGPFSPTTSTHLLLTILICLRWFLRLFKGGGGLKIGPRRKQRRDKKKDAAKKGYLDVSEESATDRDEEYKGITTLTVD